MNPSIHLHIKHLQLGLFPGVNKNYHYKHQIPTLLITLSSGSDFRTLFEPYYVPVEAVN